MILANSYPFLKQYLGGRGIDTSKHTLPNQGAHSIYTKPDNLYRLSSLVDPESLDFIFSSDNLGATKFYPILLKEWFWVLKEGGYIVVCLQESGNLTFAQLERTCDWLFGSMVQVVWTKKIAGKVFIVAQKCRGYQLSGDRISRWTFGILTKGEREVLLEQMIASIRRQHISHYEIIICGNTSITGSDCRVIPFDDRAYPKGWITRKKNIIVNTARYENICMLHDRIILTDSWYAGMQRFGNMFDVLGARVEQADQKGERAGDWLTVGASDWHEFRMGYLSYRDWDTHAYIGSGLTMVKRSLAKKFKWNEKLFRTDNEDIDFHKRLTKNGLLARVNPDASAYAYFWRFGKIPHYTFCATSLGKMQGMYRRRFLASIFRLIYRTRLKHLLVISYQYWHERMRGTFFERLITN